MHQGIQQQKGSLFLVHHSQRLKMLTSSDIETNNGITQNERTKIEPKGHHVNPTNPVIIKQSYKAGTFSV